MKKALCAWRADSGTNDFQKIGSHFCFFSLLCALFAAGLEGRKRAEDVLLGSGLKFSDGEIDGKMAEFLWISCSFDLSQVNDAAEYLEVFAPEETSCATRIIFRRGRLFTKQNIQNAINIVHPQKREIILNCLRKNNLLFEISREEASSDNCYTKYVGILRGRPYSPVASQQYRGRELLQSIAPEPNLNKPSSRPRLLSNKQNDTHTSVVVAVVVTATVTFVFAALLFCCYRRHLIASASHQNDESPLISVNLGDFSIGSSRQSYVYGSSPVNEKLGVSDSSNHKTHSSSDVNFYIGSEFLNGSHSETKSSTGPFNMSRDTSPVMPSVKPPPGMDCINSSGQLASKPHSGQIELSSSEASSSLQLPSQIVDKPTPPPPRPPLIPSSSPKPYSGCADLRPSGPPPPPPPPISPAIRPGPRPQPNVGAPPQPPPLPMGMGPKAAPRMLTPGRKDLLNTTPDDAESAKAKLKPFFWDKVQASSDHSMVWHRIKSGSFQFNEDMIEMLFGCTPGNKDRIVHKKNPSFQDPSSNYVQIIDSKKAQNLSILLRALNVTIEEVCEALNEGNELPVELLEPLLKMAPTTEEELRLRLFSGKFSQLGPAERFLKVLVNIPFAFKRLECLLFMSSFQEDVSFIKESFAILEVACKELRDSRLFLKLLEAVLKTGNRMNNGTFRGGAQAFKLDTLLKLSDVKGTDGKMTLLHFVVQEIIRFEGIRAAQAAKGSLSIKLDNLDEHLSHDSEERYRSLGLQVVLSLSTELGNVQKAAHVDADVLSSSIVKLVNSLTKARDFLNSDIKNTNENNRFPQHVKTFVEHSENIIAWMLEEEKRISSLVKRTGDYFHGNTGKDEGLRLFAVVRDFLIMLDKVCKEVENSQKKSAKPQKIEIAVVQASSSATLPAITDRQITLT